MFRKLAFISLLIFVFFLPLEKTFTISGVGTLSRAIGVAVLMLGVLSLFVAKRIEVRNPSLFLMVMTVFVLWTTASYFWSINPDDTLGGASTFFQLLVMAWLIWQLCQTFEEHFAVLQAYVWGALFSTSTALTNFLGANTQDEYLRYSGTGFDPNDFATTLALGIPMAWLLVSTRRQGILYWLNLLYIPWILFVVVLTSSRGGLLLSLFALGVIPLTYGNLTIWRKVGFLMMLAVAATIPFLDFGAGFYSQLTPNLNRLSTIGEEVSSGDLNHRTRIWRTGLEIFATHPWTGVGSGTFEQAAGPYLDRPRAPHNAYLAVLTETGLIGFSLFLALFVVVLLPLTRASTPNRTFYLVLFFTLMLALTPLNWERRKPTYFILSLLTTQNALVLVPSKRST